MLNWIKKIIYALPFGLKAANDEINSSVESSDHGVSVNEVISEKSLMNDLLKGEVTQEVEELRYRTYEVAAKSKEYDYIGNGIAVKRELRRDNKRIRFSQPCGPITSSVLDDLKHVDDYLEEHYNIEVSYNRFTRFKVEQFITMLDVLIDGEKTITKMHFNALCDPYNEKSMPFINELKNIGNAINSEYALNRNDFANAIETISFVTYNATNDYPDLMSYVFMRPKLTDYGESDTEVVLTYEWEEYGLENLKDKFFSPTMAKKYENHEKKDVAIEVPLNTSLDKDGVDEETEKKAKEIKLKTNRKRKKKDDKDRD